jgi:hypothetical protein
VSKIVRRIQGRHEHHLREQIIVERLSKPNHDGRQNRPRFTHECQR